ncbi:MAG TPA: hypothetical protein VFB28_11410 [Terriglobales bacterium]|nr:hypothetical protein [Terriglobales bacterium]
MAGSLLLLFVLQCSWLVTRGSSPMDVDSSELFRVQEGVRQWHGEGIAGTPAPERAEAPSPPPPEVEQNAGFDPEHAPLWYLLAAAGFAHSANSWALDSVRYWGWLQRVPYIIFGVLLGASLWYVARRLYGNAGGYVALILYCFSPLILRTSTLWLAEPEMGAAWGSFGAIFTAIAVAHTLYAPREVVLWNWRRILLLGLSLVLAIGCQFSLIVLLPITLVFMLYVAPTRRLAALTIWLSAVVIAFLLLFASYAFHPGIFWQGLRHAQFFGVRWQALAMRGAYGQLWNEIVQGGPALVIGFPIAVVTFLAWPRTRYFGNAAPLGIAVLFLALGVAMPHYPGGGFLLLAIPFLFVFVAGIVADLLETRQRGIVIAFVWGLLAADALLNLVEMLRIGRA